MSFFDKLFGVNRNSKKDDYKKDSESMQDYLMRTDEKFMKENKHNKRVDYQIDQNNIAREYIKNMEYEKALDILENLYESEEKINISVFFRTYLDLLYRMEEYDKAWGLTNKFVMDQEEISREELSEFRVKILKKEKKYIDALYHQILYLYYQRKDNDERYWVDEEKIIKNIKPLLKKNNIEDYQQEIIFLINSDLSESEFDKKLREIIKINT